MLFDLLLGYLSLLLMIGDDRGGILAFIDLIAHGFELS
jgi:hypothetical protein